MNNKDDNTIKRFLKIIKELKEDYFLFGNIPEIGLSFINGRRQGEDDPIFDWGDNYLNNDVAIDMIINFFISTIAVLTKKEKFDKIDKIKEIIDLVYEEKVLN